MPKKGEKNFIMSTISTRPGSEHSQKNSKTIQKSKKKKKKNVILALFLAKSG